MIDALLLVAILTTGFAPLFARRWWGTRSARLFGFVWLLAVGAFLLRFDANNPHPFGRFIFLVFFIEWLAAMLVVWINRDRISKEVTQ